MPTSQFSEQDAVITNWLLNAAATIVTTAPSYIPGGPWRLDAIFLTNTDSIDHLVALWTYDGTTVRLLGDVTVPAGAGTGSIPIVEMLSAIHAALPGLMAFPSGSRPLLSLAVAATGANAVFGTGLGGTL